MLGLHTGGIPRSQSMRGATQGREQERPLTMDVVAGILRYLIPPNGDIIPSSLLSQQLLRRHHFLSIKPSDQAAYLCLNPDHPTQDTSLVLSTLQTLSLYGRNPDQLIRRIAYFSDAEEISAHVIVGDGPAVQCVFHWDNDNETGHGAWKYADVKPIPLPNGSFDTVQGAIAAREKARAAIGKLERQGSSPGLNADDAYWAKYDAVVASVSNGRASADVSKQQHLGLPRNGSGIAYSHRSSSPRREEAYWDRYGYGDSDESDEEGAQFAAPAPRAMVGRNDLSIISPPPNQFIPTQVWTSGSTRFDPDDLSEALAMHLQPDLAPSSDIAQGLSLNLNTPPPTAPHVTTALDLSSPQADRFPPNKTANGARTNGKITNGVAERSAIQENKAVSDALRGVFQLWRASRQAKGEEKYTPIEEKDVFLSLVSQSLADL